MTFSNDKDDPRFATEILAVIFFEPVFLLIPDIFSLSETPAKMMKFSKSRKQKQTAIDVPLQSVQQSMLVNLKITEDLKGQVEVKSYWSSTAKEEEEVMATQFARIEDTLEKHLPAEELAEVRRILYGEETL